MSSLIHLFKERYQHTKKSLGQHFLTNPSIVREIAGQVLSFERSPIIEVGPGCGVLTQAIYNFNKTITVVDIDECAVDFLESVKSDFFPDIKIVHSDFLDYKLHERCVVVGNLPYNVSVKILEYCTNNINCVNGLIFMFQKEVAARIIAKPCSKDYSSLSVYSQYHYEISKLRDIGGGNFWPNAGVMSTVLVFKPKVERYLSATDENSFFDFLRAAFKQKRKTLRNNLKEYTSLSIALETMGIKSDIRAEEITLEDFIKIYEHIKL